jgi:hypothetical protein
MTRRWVWRGLLATIAMLVIGRARGATTARRDRPKVNTEGAWPVPDMP